MAELKYNDGAAWTGVSDPAIPGPAGPVGPAAPAVDTAALIQKAGDTMTGPLEVLPPTTGNHAARYVDTVPRFATDVERDAFYAALPGGPQHGMRCVVDDEDEYYDVNFGGWSYVRQIIQRWGQYGGPVPNNAWFDIWMPNLNLLRSGPWVTDGGSSLMAKKPGTYRVSGSFSWSNPSLNANPATYDGSARYVSGFVKTTVPDTWIIPTGICYSGYANYWRIYSGILLADGTRISLDEYHPPKANHYEPVFGEVHATLTLEPMAGP